MNKKSGLTLTSIVVYVSLFFVFTVFAIAMSTNMNYKAMEEKANIYIYEQFNKLQYNIVTSSQNSTSVDNIYNKIVFSNNDEYSYDSDKKVILKNNGTLVKNVGNFRIIDVAELTDVPDIYISNIDDKLSSLCLEVTFKKYGKEITKQLLITAGDE